MLTACFAFFEFFVCISEMRPLQDVIDSVAYSPDGRRAASGSDDGSIREWNLSDAPATADATQSAPKKQLGHCSRSLQGSKTKVRTTPGLLLRNLI